ncbi:MAG: hydantoinase/oxoprolinase family protein [Aromatoleum sp.]|jgi:N-methylhydantoinase A|uniref:hydantoinase/oxoprolinase family protein n=1 Tax=Aromatoleum sp. TaxID=2307007 RepID=UPI002895D5A6|nr:hydantoinase/oxoprolinase family protein [Aromatoleum sp.]MDT3671829.1 hydantoinase/oxoprolinase family protein [Aromatoleum sp.]
MFKVCVDIGGTFTDCVVCDDQGRLRQFKAPSTPKDFAQGVMDVLREAAPAYGRSTEKFIGEIDLIMHGSTVATNAVVTRNLSKTALITTKGFRDILEMRRANKIETRSMYEAQIPPYEPIVPRYLRFVLEEETRPTGEVVKPINRGELKLVIEQLKREKVESLVICFINSYANPENERLTAELCRKYLDEDVFITYSADIVPTMGEYARLSTAVISGCIGPIVSRYMTRLENGLKAAGFGGQLLIMQANQFAQSVEALKRKPVYLIGSGPSAAPAGGAFLGSMIDESNFITADMGGTTLDASLVRKGEVSLTANEWLGDELMGIKVVDVKSVGAGGGSIAWIDSLGLLRVGPQSAGADPGPCCFNKGGTLPTVTDAAVVLGYIPTGNFWEGKMALDVELSKAAIQPLADKLNMTLEATSQAIFTTVNSNMADAITEISTRKGFDVRDFSMMAFGGATPLCAAFMADLLNMNKVVIPNYAATFSAWSMFSLDIGRDFVRSYICPLSGANPADINRLYDDMLAEALTDFAALGVTRGDLTLVKSADVRYVGQYHEVELNLPEGEISASDIQSLAEEFHERHKELYTFSLPWVTVEFRNVRLIAKVKGQKIDMSRIDEGGSDSAAALKGTRQCYFGSGYRRTPIYDGDRLLANNTVAGPAVIEEPLTTLVIPENFNCSIDAYGNYLIERV